MRVPLKWLREYCDAGLDAAGLASGLAMTGTEVERIVRHGAPAVDGFVVGMVVTVAPHPDADRLKVCQVDVGESAQREIVCGAPNVAPGQTVAVALPGALMPGGEQLAATTLRGVTSDGMILAEGELEIGGLHEGVMVFDDELGVTDLPAPGTPLATVLAPGDDVLELEVTPNRPDCLGVYGVAREVHALTGAPLAALAEDVEPAGDETFAITVENHALCPRFTARMFRGVTVGQSPLWLKQRLSAAGMRPINNVVDITNYAMLLTGQPMHAFDMDLIRGARLEIRNARPGEKVTTLDDIERECDDSMVLVCDGDGPTAIAGVMGGAVSEVSPATTNVLLEVATWNGPNIHRTSQQLALRSEASSRFEKGLSPQLALEAQIVASRLMVELCGATLASGTIDVHGELAEPAPISLRTTRIERLLGAAIPRDETSSLLERLGFDVRPDGDDLVVTPPHFRMFDVTREADAIEELARFHIDDLPTTLPAARAAVGGLTQPQRLRRRLENACRDRGLNEAIGWSFTSRDVLDRLVPGDGGWPGELIEIANPLSEDQAVMRPLVSPGLLLAAQHNFARGAQAVRLFEIGKTYRPPAGDGLEPLTLALLLAGPVTADGWRSKQAPGDFYALKGVLDTIAAAASVEFTYAPDAGQTALHPGRSAAVSMTGDDGAAVEIGFLGELHPLVARAFDLEAAVVAEIDLDALVATNATEVTIYEPFSEFPAVREDIAVVVDDDLPAAAVLHAAQAAGGELLTAARLFDVYRGEQVGAGKVSLAIGLEFSALDRTLTDDEVAGARAAITERLAAIGGQLRG